MPRSTESAADDSMSIRTSNKTQLSAARPIIQVEKLTALPAPSLGVKWQVSGTWAAIFCPSKNRLRLIGARTRWRLPTGFGASCSGQTSGNNGRQPEAAFYCSWRPKKMVRRRLRADQLVDELSASSAPSQGADANPHWLNFVTCG